MMIGFDVSETAMWCLESDRRVCLTSSLLNPRPPRTVEWSDEASGESLSPGLSFTVYSQTLCVYAQA
jgi:hypothetical protein